MGHPLGCPFYRVKRMATWTTPKTNWQASYDEDGNYTGDYFSYDDFNRIRNNLDALSELGAQLYFLNFTAQLPNTKSVTGYPFASDINAFETRLHELNNQTIRLPIGTKQTFVDNGAFIGFAELNRIESAMVTMYKMFNDALGGRKMLKFRLGLPSSAIRF